MIDAVTSYAGELVALDEIPVGQQLVLKRHYGDQEACQNCSYDV